MLYSVEVKYFTLDKKAIYLWDSKKIIGLDNAIIMAEQLSKAENATSVNVIDSFTGEVMWDWNKF